MTGASHKNELLLLTCTATAKKSEETVRVPLQYIRGRIKIGITAENQNFYGYNHIFSSNCTMI
jgi:hypothetical protein